MPMTLLDRFKSLRDHWERLSQRERTLVSALGATFVVMSTLVVGFLITDGLSTLDEHNADMRQALHDVETQRESYLRAKAKTAQMETRIGRTPVQLQGFLEQIAKETGVEIPESNELTPTAAGKHFIQRSVELRLRQVPLDALARFLKSVETGPNLVVVTALNVHTRDDRHQQLDVEMTVSTYERASEKKEKSSGKKGEKS
jgi:type II secretory pathway component PulM